MHEECPTCGDLHREDEYCPYCMIPMQWIPVSHRLPEIPEDEELIPVLATIYDPEDSDPPCVVEVSFGLSEEGKPMFLDLLKNGGDLSKLNITYAVTHWMPMPRPPEVKPADAK